MNRLRILHLLSSSKLTGPAEPILRLARFQQDRGHDVRLAIDLKRRGNLKERAGSFGVSVDENLFLSPAAGPILQLKNMARLRRMWRNDALDIIHANPSNDHFLAAMMRPRTTSVGLIRALHTERAQGPFRKWLLNQADGWIVVAEKYRQRLLDRGWPDPNRIAVIDGVVDTKKFDPFRDRGRIRRETGIGPDTPVAGIVAHLKKGRGHRLLLESWSRVHQVLPEAVLFIAGRGSLLEDLKAFGQHMPWRKSVRFIGYRKDLPEVYPSLNVKVILAPGNDGTCRAALEAMASGVPVLAADVGALSEIIGHGETGLLVPNHDRKALAEAMIALLSNPQKAREMGINARRAVETRFTIERKAERVERLYRYVLDQKLKAAAAHQNSGQEIVKY